jgi:metal-dependent amidase/aminoacylase/carboxypeptidase family protein
MLADIATYNIFEASPKVTNCYAIHLTSGMELGNIGYTTGPITANSERWSIDVIGNKNIK